MASLINHPNATNFANRFRAFCRDDNFLGKWRQTEAEATADADAHTAKPGNEDHTMEIEIEQRFSVVLNG